MNLVAFVFSLLLQKPNFCSCTLLAPMDDKQFNEYSLIIKGRVVKVIEGEFKRVIHFSVDSFYKGNQQKGLVEVVSPSSSGMCGIFPKKGENWLVFAYTKSKSYETHLCTRTKNMNSKVCDYNEEELKADLKYLEAKGGNDFHFLVF